VDHVTYSVPRSDGTRAIADGASFAMPATIDDPAILDEITTALRTLGLAKS